MADLQTRLTRGDGEEALEKLPSAERTQRLAGIQKTFTGIRIEGETEPSDGLLDMVRSMNETGQLKYTK